MVDDSNPRPRRSTRREAPVIEGSAEVIGQSPPPETKAGVETLKGPDASAPGAAPVDTGETGLDPTVAKPASNAAPPAEKRSVALAYAAGALAGLALATLGWVWLVGSGRPSAQAVDARVAGVEQKFVDAERRIDAAEAGIQKTNDAAAAMANGVAAAEASAKAAAGAAEQARADASQALVVANTAPQTAPSGGAPPLRAADLQPLDERIARLEAVLTQPKAEGRAEAEPVVPARSARASENAAALVVVAQSLIQTIERGAPFVRQAAVLDVLGADPARVAALKPIAETGAPSLRALSEKFSELSRSLVTAGGEVVPGGGILDRLLARAARLVRVRPVGDIVGDNPSAIVARIEAALANGRTAEALAAWDKLPSSAKALSQNWANDLRAQADAEAAAQAVLAEAMTSLSKTKPWPDAIPSKP